MKRCRSCKVPLEGFWGKTLAKLLGVKLSAENPEVCNKCAVSVKKQKGNYVCSICQRVIDEEKALTHVKSEEYLLELIRKDHPEWKEEHGACPKCLDYYRQLVKEAKI